MAYDREFKPPQKPRVCEEKQGASMRRLLYSIVVVAALVAPLPAASVDGLNVHWSSAGKGASTVVFVHGWTCDSSSWGAQLPAVAAKYRAITVDLPGHGQSGAPADGKFSMDLFARAVEAVREEAKAERIALVGHSMGAPVIRQYARLYPHRVAALVAADGPLDMRDFRIGQPPPPMTGSEGLKAREAMIRTMFTPQTPQALQQQVLAMMLKAPEATASGAMAAMFDPALRTDDVTPVPALAIYAGSRPVPPDDAARKALPKFEATQIPGTGHFLMMENPGEFNRLLMAFLERVGI
jgi:pimeloyl-ACP methyl ester carboxylesterase